MSGLGRLSQGLCLLRWLLCVVALLWLGVLWLVLLWMGVL